MSRLPRLKQTVWVDSRHYQRAGRPILNWQPGQRCTPQSISSLRQPEHNSSMSRPGPLATETPKIYYLTVKSPRQTRSQQRQQHRNERSSARACVGLAPGVRHAA